MSDFTFDYGVEARGLPILFKARDAAATVPSCHAPSEGLLGLVLGDKRHNAAMFNALNV